MLTKIKAAARKRKIVLLLVIIALLLVSVSTVLGGENINITYSTTINRPVEEVWAFTSQPENAQLWVDGMVENRATSPGNLSAGTTGVQIVETLGVRNEATWEVLDYQENATLTYAVTSGPLEGLIVVEYAEPTADGGTLFTYAASGSVAGFPGIPNNIAAYMFERQLANNFDNLRALLESQ